MLHRQIKPVCGFLVLLAVTPLTGCGRISEGAMESFRESGAPALDGSWQALLRERRLIDLECSGPDEQLLRIYHILIDDSDNLIISDNQNGKILVFTSSGRLLHAVGKKGQGPGEFSLLGHTALDAEGRLVAFDIQSSRFSYFEPPGFGYSRSFQVAAPVSQVVALKDGLAYYTPYNPDLVTKIDLAGKTMASALSANSRALRLFLARFQNGGISTDGEGGLYAIYPETFTIFHLDNNLRTISRIEGGGSSRWRPDSPLFPDTLSPYLYTPSHQRWWDSHLHVDRVFDIGRDLLGVTLYKSKGLASLGWYLNLYSKKGEVIAEGLPVPHAGRVVAAKDCRLWVATNASLNENGEIKPLELREYSVQGEGLCHSSSTSSSRS